MCNQWDAVGSAWILNFQRIRRCYVTRRRQTNARQASFCTWSMAERIWVLVQATPRLLTETLRRKMIWTGVITTWAYSLQMFALGYVSRFGRYQHSHQRSVWSEWLKDALFRSAYVCKRRMLKLYSLATPGLPAQPRQAQQSVAHTHTLHHRRNKMAASTKVAFWTKNKLLSSHRLLTGTTGYKHIPP